MLTKGIFCRVEWNYLLRLFNVLNFSMFSCIHFSNFLSDSIGKQSAMSKRGQDATSSERSPMAKPNPTVPAKARPLNLVLHSSWSARENLSQNLDTQSVRGTTMKARTRRSVQTIQNPEVERSQVKRQEKVQIPGNRATRRNLRTLLVQGDLCRQHLRERNFKI